jgi:hypothetical protein
MNRVIVDVLHEILHLKILLFVILNQMIKRSYPSLLNELIVTSELPSDLLFGVFW